MIRTVTDWRRRRWRCVATPMVPSLSRLRPVSTGDCDHRLTLHDERQRRHGLPPQVSVSVGEQAGLPVAVDEYGSHG